MKRVRVTIHPQDLDTPSLYRVLTDADYLSTVETVNWNNRASPAGFLLRIRGDYERLEAELDRDGEVLAYDLLPVTDDECYLFLEGEGPADSRALWENFTRGSLMTVPPVAWNDDGSSTFTMVGTESDVQAAVEGVPEGVRVDVERVGGETVDDGAAVGRLTARQREAVRAALDAGYYAVPRECTVADVAARLDCAPSTAAEHLQRAESKAVSALFDR